MAFWTMATAMATAQLNLQVTVHCEEPGTLFVKIMEQIEEVGELTDISELTISGQLNLDDYNVISNQLSFPQAVTKVGYQAFYSMTAPKRIVLPDQITSIGSAPTGQ